MTSDHLPGPVAKRVGPEDQGGGNLAGLWRIMVPLLLLAAAFPTGPANAQGAPTGTVLIQDAADDVTQPALTSTIDQALFGFVDVRSLSIVGETEEDLIYELAVGHAEAGAWGQAQGHAYSVHMDINYTLDGQPYQILLRSMVEAKVDETGTHLLVLNSHFYSCKGTCQESYMWYGQYVTIIEERNVLRFAVAKMTLASNWRNSYYYAGATYDVAPGAILGAYHIDSYVVDSHLDSYNQYLDYPPAPVPPVNRHVVPYSTYLKDSAPGDGKSGTYTLGSVPWGKSLEVRLINATMPLSPGRVQSVPLRVTSYSTERQMVNLTYEFVQKGEPVPGFETIAPRSIVLAGGTSRNLTMTLRVPSTLPREDEAISLIVQGRSALTGDESKDEAMLVPGMRLGPGANKLYYHSKTVPAAAPSVGSLPTVPGYATAYLSPNQQEPDADPETWAPYYITSGTCCGGAYHYTKLPLSTPTFLEGDGLVTFKTKVATRPLARDEVRLVATLESNKTWGYGRILITTFSKTFQGTDAGTEITLTGRVPPEGILLDTTASLYLSLAFFGEPTFNPLLEEMAGERAYVHAGSTSITLPLLDVAEEGSLGPGSSPFQFSVEGSDYFPYFAQWINPGESRLYNLTVTNVDLVPHHLRLETNLTGEGWLASVMPGAEFEVPPAEAATISLAIRAPNRDEDYSNVTLVARADDNTTRIIRFFLRSTNLSDYPDQSDWYVAREGDLTPYAPPTTPTPSLGVWTVPAILAAFAFRRWRARNK